MACRMRARLAQHAAHTHTGSQLQARTHQSLGPVRKGMGSGGAAVEPLAGCCHDAAVPASISATLLLATQSSNGGSGPAGFVPTLIEKSLSAAAATAADSQRWGLNCTIVVLGHMGWELRYQQIRTLQQVDQNAQGYSRGW
jgi:hypothetical protein